MNLRDKLLAGSIALTSGAAFAADEVIVPKEPFDIMANINLQGVSAMQDKVVLVMIGIVITGLAVAVFKRYAK